MDYIKAKITKTQSPIASDMVIADNNLAIDSIIVGNSGTHLKASEISIEDIATKEYVDEHVGAIDSISIDGTPQTIDENKNVDLPAYPTKESLGLSNVDNTSDATKKSNFTGSIADENTGFITGGDVYIALAGKQATLVSEENIKTINGNSLLISSGDPTNIQTEAYHTFPNTWHTGYGYNTQEFCESVEADTSAVAGTAYLGTLGCNDLPASMGQAEAIVEIISDGANGKCMNITLTSLTNKPYRWTYSYGRVNSHIRTVGWLEISGQTVKVGNTTFALNADIDLVAGNNVTITPATSGTGAPKITIAAKDTTYSDATTGTSGLMSAEDKTKLNGIESGAQVNAANTVIDADYHHISVSSSDGVSDGTNTYKYVLPSDVVQDSNYAHITVNSSSVSDGTTTISNIVSDANYVHTDNNFNDTYKGYVDTNNQKVSNVQSDWNASSGAAQILNKPSIYTQSEVNNLLADKQDKTAGISYLTTAPSSANTDGGLKFVVLSSEPATKYSGYIYIITA